MPIQMKRPAAAAVAKEPKAKVQKQEDPHVSKCNSIVSLLDSAEGYPIEILRMLAGAVQSCLSEPREGRHDVQKAVIEMIAEVLGSVESGHVAKVAALRSKLAEADTEKDARHAAYEAGVAAKSEKADAVGAAETALEEAVAGIAAANAEFEMAVAEQRTGDKDLENATGRKALAESLLNNDVLIALKDGTAADVPGAVKAVSKLTKDLGFEEQLMASAAMALRKLPSERGGFDGMVVQQLDEQIGGTIEKCAELLAAGETGKAERAAKVEERRRSLDAAVAHREASQEQLKSAKAALKEAEAARKAAQRAVEDLGPEMAETEASAEVADAALVACRADLAVFRELVEGPPAAPEAVVAEADGTADAAVEAEAQA